MACSLGVIVYSISVLGHVASMGTIGVSCLFGTKVAEDIPPDYIWSGSRPRAGDELVGVGRSSIAEGNYADYIRALRGLSDQIDQSIEVRWRDRGTGVERTAQATV